MTIKIIKHDGYVKVLKFFLTGIFNTFLSFATFSMMYALIGNYNISVLTAYLITMFFSYIMNKNWVFRDSEPRGNPPKKVGGFILVNIISLTINLLSLFVLIDILLVNPYISQMISLIFVVLFNFIGYDFIFSKSIKDKNTK